MIIGERIIQAAKEAVIGASSRFREDQLQAYYKALEIEEDEKSKWVLKQNIENALLASLNHSPICDDTGIPHIVLSIGNDEVVPGKIQSYIQQGIKEGLAELPGRPMAVIGNEMERLGQTLGMYDDPSKLEAAPVLLMEHQGKGIKITVLMLGGGPEIRGKTYRVFHKHDGQNVINEVIGWIKEGVSKLGCTPAVPFVGIGRTHFEASSYMLRAMYEANFNHQTDIEQQIVTEINKENVGSLGLGGNITSLGAFVRIAPQRASGVRIVSMRLGCSIDPRRHSVCLE
ncbi:fumarate hydratase [Psychrobacillus sp. NPDC096389]|uniref:fumarate hydratase n=1 Tax=Psychrobacillus sp. NPDC096389 TaxID=3364490 RepID=UPI0037FF270E